jgi:putative transposase
MEDMTRKAYPTDLTDKEWKLLEPLIPPPKPGGRPRRTDMREVVNAIFYQLRSGGAWRLLPHEFPPWSTVYGYFNRWSKDGTRERMNACPRLDQGPAFAATCESPKAVILNRVPPSWTARASRRRKKGATRL